MKELRIALTAPAFARIKLAFFSKNMIRRPNGVGINGGPHEDDQFIRAIIRAVDQGDANLCLCLNRTAGELEREQVEGSES